MGQPLSNDGACAKITGRPPVIQIPHGLKILCVNDVTHREHNIKVKNQQYGWHDIALCCRLYTLDLGTRPTQGPYRAFQDLFSVYFTEDSIPFFDSIIQSIAVPSP